MLLLIYGDITSIKLIQRQQSRLLINASLWQVKHGLV